MTLGQIILVALVIATLIVCSKLRKHGNELAEIEEKLGLKAAEENEEE